MKNIALLSSAFSAWRVTWAASALAVTMGGCTKPSGASVERIDSKNSAVAGGSEVAAAPEGDNYAASANVGDCDGKVCQVKVTIRSKGDWHLNPEFKPRFSVSGDGVSLAEPPATEFSGQPAEHSFVAKVSREKATRATATVKFAVCTNDGTRCAPPISAALALALP